MPTNLMHLTFKHQRITAVLTISIILQSEKKIRFCGCFGSVLKPREFLKYSYTVFPAFSVKCCWKLKPKEDCLLKQNPTVFKMVVWTLTKMKQVNLGKSLEKITEALIWPLVFCAAASFTFCIFTASTSPPALIYSSRPSKDVELGQPEN